MKRTNTAKWIESRGRWQINVQKDGIRKTFVSSKPGRTGQVFSAISAASHKLYPDTEPLTISAFTERIIAAAEINVSSAALRKAITGWLKDVGFLKTYTDEEGKNSTDVTSISESVGIFAEERAYAGGVRYKRVMYTPEAQQFIIDNLASVREYAVECLSE